ncbi:MAG TPA: DMT family transporter [Flavobacteriales bacterium]|nr:DMT family transporter [Flavobacteriales bacterium]
MPIADRNTLAHIALFIVNAIYGINYVIAKGLMPEAIGPNGFVLMRVLGAGALFWLIYALRFERPAIADLVRLFLCGLFGVAVNQTMFFNGLMRTSPINSSTIMVATPILVLVLSAILINERVTPTKVLGVVLGACGALALIFFKPSDGGTGATLLGDLFILINAISYGIYLVIVKPLMRKYNAITVMAWSFLFGLLIITPFSWKELSVVQWHSLSNAVLASFLFVVIMVTFVAYLLNTWALGIVSASVVGTYIYIQPVLAALGTWLFMRIGAERLGIPGQYETPFGLPQLICGAAIFLGVYLVSKREKEFR